MTPHSAPDDTQNASDVGVPHRWPFDLGRVLWVANVATLVVFAAWILLDPKILAAAHVLKGQVHQLAGDAVADHTPPLGPRVPLLWLLLVVGVVSTIGIFVALFVGGVKHRGMRSWLAFTFLIAGWLTILVAGQELAWQGQRLRLCGDLAGFDAIARSLRDDWPKADGTRAGLGQFMAYPQGQPRMLMMLTSETDPPIAAVERWDDGSFGFELRGDDTGAWLVWHPENSQPRGFVGGLEAEYKLGRASKLGRGWYLVRYR